QTREFNYVTDLARGFVAAALHGEPGRLYNLGCGEEVSMRDLATTLLALMGDPITAQLGALPERPTEIWRMHADATRARTELGWAPEVALQDGLARTVEWYRRELARDQSSFAV
ncbi:MAG: GDP-mannose 4,6-dehydratase, partial [Mycobacteriales bacterium]